MEDKREEARVRRGSVRFQCTFDIYWRRRRKENWVEKDCSTLLREFWLGKQGVFNWELPFRRVLCPTGRLALPRLQCSVIGWLQFRRGIDRRCTQLPALGQSQERRKAERDLGCFDDVVFRDCKGFPSSSVVKNLPASARDAGDTGSIPESRRYLGGGNGNRLQYSCLGVLYYPCHYKWQNWGRTVKSLTKCDGGSIEAAAGVVSQVCVPYRRSE